MISWGLKSQVFLRRYFFTNAACGFDASAGHVHHQEKYRNRGDWRRRDIWCPVAPSISNGRNAGRIIKFYLFFGDVQSPVASSCSPDMIQSEVSLPASQT